MVESDSSDVNRILASIVNYSDDAIITKTLDGIVTSWNRGAEKMFGYASEEVIGRHISILIPAGRIDEEPQIINKIKSGEIVDHYETERIRKDGSLISISLVVSATRNSEGKIFGILKIARDITFKKKAEEVQSRMADIINLSDDAIYSKTLDGVISSWNKGAEKIYGYTRHEAIGKNVAMLIPPGRTDESPRIIGRVSKGESIEHYETERVRKDGSLLHISLSVSPVKDLMGKVTGVLIVARDVTIPREADLLQKRLASIINFSDDAIISKTLQGIITSWNNGAQKIFGYTADEAVGKHVSILIPPGRLDEEPEIIAKVSSGQSIDHYQTERVRKDGSIVYISLTVSPIKDTDGRIVGVSKIARDISEQKNRENEIRRLNEELEAFSYSVAHDLQSPLRSVLSYSQLLEEKHATSLPEDGQQLLRRIIKQSQRMDGLIKDLLNLSKSGGQQLEVTEIDIESMVKETADDIRSQQNGKSIQINVAPLSPAIGDRSLVRQVWENLISNAVKYSKKQEEIIIEIGSSVAPDNQVVYFVKDNGVGFDMKYADKLFKAFKRLHNRTEYEGTGVGLAIVNQIISKHGGRAWAESRPNKGATFYFSLPGAQKGKADNRGVPN